MSQPTLFRSLALAARSAFPNCESAIFNWGRYHPPHFALGAAISLATAGAIALLLVISQVLALRRRLGTAAPA